MHQILAGIWTRALEDCILLLTCGDGASWAVDIHDDVLVVGGGIQVQQLGHNQVGHVIVHWTSHPHNALHITEMLSISNAHGCPDHQTMNAATDSPVLVVQMGN